MADRDKYVLIVDDTLVTRRCTAFGLHRLGYQTQEAANAQEGLALFKEASYAAILMDFTLPGISGPECTRKIRQLEEEAGLARTPIIGMSSHNLHTIREKCLQAGMDDCIEKSCTRHELLETFSKWIPSASESTE